jgi:hypothetical protein
MQRICIPLFSACILLTGVSTAEAQQSPDLVELQFVRDLRARRYGDLALEYLERLRKSNPSPELLRELPLELAITRLDNAPDEPDSGKRLAIFEQARSEIEAFLKENPTHARAGEARLDIARVVVLQGKTQLSRALTQDASETRTAEGVKARQKFEEAAVLLQKAAEEIDGLIGKVSDPKTAEERARRLKLDNDRLQAQLDVALNALDQASTYLDESSDKLMIERGKKVQAAIRILEKLANVDVSNPICWQAAAWWGDALDLNGEPPKARAKLFEVINSALPASADGRRLARYFRLRIQNDEPLDEEKGDPKFKGTLINDASSWLVNYPSFARTPEGNGVRYLLAELLKQRADDKMSNPAQRTTDLARARRLLKDIELTENDFTDRARRLKIAIIRGQGGFDHSVESLRTFEDCYVRAQYEVFSASEAAKPGKDGKQPDANQIEEIRKKHTEKAIEALRLGLRLPDAKPDKGKVSPEVNNAKAMLAFYCLNLKKYRDAIAAGEGFARDDPRSSQAALAAVYALQAYAQVIAEREHENALPEELRPDREKMLALARYAEERWPKEPAGDMARHQIALALLRDEKLAREPADQVRLLGDALAKLRTISKEYVPYIVVQYQFADACLQADRDGLEPLPGQKAGDYRRQALAALKALPDPAAGTDPAIGQVYLMGKVRFAWELYKDKQFDEMMRLSEELSKKLPGMSLEDAVRQQMQANVADVRLFATGSVAEADFHKARFPEVAAKLDPLAAAMNSPDAPDNRVVAAELKKNLQLGSALLSMDLRANIQLGRLDRVESTLNALQSLTAEGDDQGGAAKILQTLVYLIKQQVDELDKKGDTENKAKAVAGFSKILDKVAEKPDKLETQPRLLLAQCYANMGGHRKAADLLEKVATPAEKGAHLLYARELRLAQDLEKARQTVNQILGTATAPGWGARNVDALLEDVALTEDEGKYDKAALKANDIVRKLLPSVMRDNALKEKYLEAYYHVVYSFVKFGQAQSDASQKEKALRRAALQTVELEKKWPNYGGDSSARRFSDLLSKESDFKEVVERIKSSEK